MAGQIGAVADVCPSKLQTELSLRLELARGVQCSVVHLYVSTKKTEGKKDIAN